MSNSPGDKKVVGTLRVPAAQNGGAPTGPDPIAAEIQAEINDHLATSAEQLQSHGATSAEARAQSQEQFGDAATISRRCYWIKQGDALMFRTAVIVLLSLLCLALGATVFTSWRSQRQTADQMTALAEQLKALAEQQRSVASTPPSAAEPKPLEITGQVYVGSPDKPSPNTEVMICRVGDGEVVRRVTTGDDGTFRSGPLVAGDYTLLANGVRPPEWKGSMGMQTAPIYLYPGQQSPNVAIDVRYRHGGIRVKLSNPLPDMKVEGKYIIASRLYLSARPSEAAIHSTRWTTASPMPDHWPMLIRSPESPPPPLNPPKDYEGVQFSPTYAIVSADDLKKSDVVEFKTELDPLPAGPCSLVAVIVADVAPDAPFDIDEMISRMRLPTVSGKPMEWMSDHWVRQAGKGGIWHTMLLDNTKEARAKEGRGRAFGGPRDFVERTDLFSNVGPLTSQGSMLDQTAITPRLPLMAEVVIGDGQFTTLEVSVPSDMQSRIERLVTTVTDPDEFQTIVKREPLFVQMAKIAVLGTEPLKPSDEPGQ
jgi:type II secretory pathway pseudopilin PulG